MGETTNNGNGGLICKEEGCFFFGRGKTAALEGLANKSRNGSCLRLSAVAELRVGELVEKGLESAARGASYVETIKCMEGQREAESAATSLEP